MTIDEQYFEVKNRAAAHLHLRSDFVAASIITQYFPHTPKIQKKISRPAAVIYMLADNHHKTVLRLSSNPHWLSVNTAKAYNAWNQLGVPAPTIHTYGEIEDLQYLIMDVAKGREFAFDQPHHSQLTTLSQMGQTLATMRAVYWRDYGYLGTNGDGTSATWHDFLHFRYVPSRLMQANLISKNVFQKIERFIASLALESTQPVILHGDFKPKNMFVNDIGQLETITDPQPISGDPLWDVAICNHFVYREQARQHKPPKDQRFEALRKAFLENYELILGRKLTAEELIKITGYELLVGCEKAEMLRRNNKLEESDRILTYLRETAASF